MRFIVLLSLAGLACLRGEDAQITVDPAKILAPVSPYLTGVCMEDVNHEIYGGIYSQMVFGESFQEPGATAGLSKCWKPVERGTAQGKFELAHDTPFVGAQSQRIEFSGGSGEWGLSNAGLNGQGMSLSVGSAYKADIWARAPQVCHLRVQMVNADGTVFDSKLVPIEVGDWRLYAADFEAGRVGTNCRLEITLDAPGTVDLGYVFFRPITEGRFAGQRVRRDVAEKLVEQGVTVMRYGGSMINDPAYRWKNMTGPRAKRPPTHGTWYPFSTNGWGIPDFCALCDAGGFLGIPAFNMGEAPQDMADFLEYAHGGVDTKWGFQRIGDGFMEPFKVRVIELGNEEKVDEDYWKKFEPMARAIWSRDPKMILTVGDFHYDNVITDPFHFAGGAVDTLAAHRKILALAKEYGAEVWFDVHLGTQEIPAANALDPLLSYIRALQGMGSGAKFHVVTYELNADRHDLTRALANARMIGMIERAGAEPVVTSANALQVDGQNDNGWNQGLLFMTPDKVWLQPPGYVTQMMSRNRLANVVQADSSNPNLDVTATASADGKAIVLQVVNFSATPVDARLHVPNATSADVSTLAGDPETVNTAGAPEAIEPRDSKWSAQGSPACIFPPHSFTVMRLK